MHNAFSIHNSQRTMHNAQCTMNVYFDDVEIFHLELIVYKNNYTASQRCFLCFKYINKPQILISVWGLFVVLYFLFYIKNLILLTMVVPT